MNRGSRGEVIPESNEGPPDSERPNGLCPRCDRLASFRSAGTLPLTFDYETYSQDSSGRTHHEPVDRVSCLICQNCRQATAVIEEQWIGEGHYSERQGGKIWWKGIHWWPLPEAQVSSDVPVEIAKAYSEAARSLAANCARAAAVMARRTLEAVTADKGQTSGSLATRLEALSKAGVLQPTLSDWAKEVRLIGNVGAHFDPIQPVQGEDASQLLSFLRELLKYLYEIPAQLHRRRQRPATP